VQRACDVFRPIYDATEGYDGRVSIEVTPGAARDTEETITEAKALWAKVDRPNVMIKIPATKEGLPAITEAIASGISVNVTLIFSLQRYAEVIAAYLSGLERAAEAGLDLSKIHSVASFFVSRVDTEIDKRLDAIGTDEAKALKSTAGIANARLAFQLFVEEFATERALALQEKGANRQRPLWASTGVKSPDLPDTLYVVELTTHGVVNTMPGKTLEATFDHGEIQGDKVTGAYAEAKGTIDAIGSLGISIDEVTQQLEDEGVDKFVVSWNELTDTVATALEGAK
jgi:transaldolase